MYSITTAAALKMNGEDGFQFCKLHIGDSHQVIKRYN